VTDLERIIEIKRTLTAAVDEYVTHAPLGQSPSDARITSST
jgi:hypothetical protein